MWRVELDPFGYFEDVWTLIYGDQIMMLGDSSDVDYLRELCAVLNQVNVCA